MDVYPRQEDSSICAIDKSRAYVFHKISLKQKLQADLSMNTNLPASTSSNPYLWGAKLPPIGVKYLKMISLSDDQTEESFC